MLGFGNGQDIQIILGRWKTPVSLLLLIVPNLRGYSRAVVLDGYSCSLLKICRDFWGKSFRSRSGFEPEVSSAGFSVEYTLHVMMDNHGPFVVIVHLGMLQCWSLSSYEPSLCRYCYGGECSSLLHQCSKVASGQLLLVQSSSHYSSCSWVESRCLR